MLNSDDDLSKVCKGMTAAVEALVVIMGLGTLLWLLDIGGKI